ncbi:MAG: tRNA pseudouridine(55) synthase TruB [Nitrospirales bacterium]
MELLLPVHETQWISNNMTSSLQGVLNINKPAGWTSHDVVQRLRRVLGIRKVGHAGTLDPAATGVLPVLLGKGTKIAEHLLHWEKEYRAVLRLGQSTDTQDATGRVVQESSTDAVTEDQIRSIVKEFRGDIQQIPPMYSAVKVKGQPLYKAARRGETVERSPRTVTIYRLEVLAVRGRDVDLRVVCSKGTYIRTLCVDIGNRLKVGGHLLTLERSRVGPFHVQDALDLEDVNEGTLALEKNPVFLTIDNVLEKFPVVTVKSEYVTKVINGAPIPWEAVELSSGDSRMSLVNLRIRVRGPEGNLLAFGVVRDMNCETPVCIENVLVEK